MAGNRKQLSRGMALLLAVLMMISSPLSVLAANAEVTEVKDDGADLDYIFTQTNAEDDTSADITIEVIEKKGNILTEIQLPDGTVIRAEAQNGVPGFKQLTEGSEKNIVHYTAMENGIVKFKVKYQLPISAADEVQEETSFEGQESEVSYEVKGISKEMETENNTEADAAQEESLFEGQESEVSHEVKNIFEEMETENNTEADVRQNGAKNTTDNSAQLSDVDTDISGSISFSVNNREINNPSEFVIGEPKHELINLTVRYASSGGIGRKMKITIPQGFSLVKAPIAADLDSISQVKQNGNTIELIIIDSVNVTTVFDIQVRQDKELLYKNASVSAKGYEFLLEGFANGTDPVLNEMFIWDIAELADPEYQIEINSDLDWSKMTWPDSSSERTSVSFKLKITKPEKTKRQEDFTIIIPKTLKNEKYFVESSSSDCQVYINGTSYRSEYGVAVQGDYMELKPRLDSGKALFQNTYVKSNTMDVTITYSDAPSVNAKRIFFRNEKYESLGNLSLKEKDTAIYETKLTVDTSSSPSWSDLNNNSIYIISEPDSFGQYAGKVVTNKIRISPSWLYGFMYNLKDFRIQLQIPEEFQFKGIEGVDETCISEIITNKGNRITLGDVVNLPDAEYVKSLSINQVQLHHTFIALKLNLYIREERPDGSNISSGTVASVKAKFSSAEDVDLNAEKTINYTIVRKEQDNIRIRVPHDYVQTRSLIGDKNQYIGMGGQIISKDNTMIYKNAEFEIIGPEILSLIDEISLTQGDTQEMAKMKARYTTNLDATEKTIDSAVVGSFWKIKIPLSVGEYLTSLKICSDELDLYKNQYSYYIQLDLFSSRAIPERLPLDGSALENKQYDITMRMTAENSSNIHEDRKKSCTFAKPVDDDILSTNDLSAIQIVPTDESIELASIQLDNIADINRIRYHNAVIDFTGTDPELLARIRNFQVSKDGTQLPYAWHITTNQRSDLKVNGSHNGTEYSFGLRVYEYITSLKMVWEGKDYIPDGVMRTKLRGIVSTKSPITGEYIGDDNKAYDVKVSFEADNKAKYEREGKSVSISGKSSVTVSGITNTVNLDSKVYQGNSFDVSITPKFQVAGLSYNKYKVQNPVCYLEVDSRYSFESGSVKTESGEAKITWEPKKLANGNSVLKIEFLNYEKEPITSTFQLPFSLKLRVNPTVDPQKGIQPIPSLWVDLSETAALKQPEGYASIVLQNTVKDTLGLQDDVNKKFYTNAASFSGGQEILPIAEMGVSSMGMENASYGATLIGHDNDSYGQQISIISNYDVPTRDWIIYIPIPKEGKSIHYKKIENGAVIVGSSPIASIGMNLTGPVSLGAVMSNVFITYTTDDDPLYAMDGSDVGSYSNSVTDWSKVTMVKIKIPELGAKGKLYPILNYTSDTKLTTGQLSCYGGAYFNTKIGDATAYYYGDDGTYAVNHSYTVIDYTVTGTVWEEKNVPSNDIMDAGESKKSSITISSVDKAGKIWSAVTDEKGKYILTIPSGGSYDIEIQMPDKENTKPMERYSLVQAEKGTASTSSKFGPVTKKAAVILDKGDVLNINGGLWAERNAFVEPDDIYIKVGGTEAVPVYFFPGYVNVTYGQSDDTSIAAVDANGKITGVMVGVVTAEVSIPDGKGGTVTDSYKIHVVPNKPTAIPETVHLFEGGSFNDKEGVQVFDGDGNKIDVNDNTLVTITNPVDISKPGKYIVTYTIYPGEYNEVKAYRSIYVHEKISIGKPDDWTTKIGENVTSLEGVMATYGQVQEDGSIRPVEVPVTAVPDGIFTKNAAGSQSVELSATVTYEGATDNAVDSYTVKFNERPVITAPDSVKVKVGATADDIRDVINGTANMNTADDRVDLTKKLIYVIPDDFDTSQALATGTVTLRVTDPDTGEVVEKTVTVKVSGLPVIQAEDMDKVIGQAYDTAESITITDEEGNPVTLASSMITTDPVIVNADGKLSEIGEYEVSYQYTDAYGNIAEANRKVRVNGALVLNAPYQNLRKADEISYTPSAATAYYMNSKNEKVDVTGGTYDKEVDQGAIGRTEVTFTAIHPISGETTDKAFMIFVHGNPVIMAEGDIIYTHSSTADNIVISVVKDGSGNNHKAPASAYVEYVEADGSTGRVDLTAKLNYELDNAYVALAAGVYPVKLSVSDVDVVSEHVLGLTPAIAGKSADVTVEDQIHKITFDSGEKGTFEEGDNKEVDIVHGNSAEAEQIPTPKADEGYAFDKWVDKEGNTIEDLTNYPIDSDTRITGIFKAKEYRINYDMDGGKPETIAAKTVHYTDIGLTPETVTPTKDGYIFVGWKLADKDIVVSKESTYKDLVADDTVMEVTLAAKWEIKHFTASWVLREGEILGSIDGGDQKEERISYNENAAKEVTATPISNDSEFIGWEYSYIPDGSTTPVTGFTNDYKTIPVLGDITFTAKFAAKPFVSIGATNGKVTAAKGSTPEEISGSSGSIALIQYTVAEDIETNRGTVALKYAADMHHHLTTIFFKDMLGHEYTIWRKDGGGTTTGPDYEVGDKTPATKVKVAVDEKTGVIQISNIDTSLAFTVVFEEDAKYKVEFFRDKDDPDSLVQTNDGLYTGNPVGAKPDADPIKAGYEFLGWSIDGTNSTDKMYDKDFQITDSNMAYYGVWELVDYKLTLSNTVDGEHGNKKQDFHFIIKLKDKVGTPLSGTYSYTGTAINGVTKPNDGTITLDADGRVEITLRHGQSIVLDGLHITEQYNIEEVEANQNGYVTTATGDRNPNVTGDFVTAFTNTRTTTPPTGIGSISHLPIMILGVVLLILTCAGFIWARRRRRA